MDTEEALGILREMLHQIPPLLGPVDKKAIGLGIEALEEKLNREKGEQK